MKFSKIFAFRQFIEEKLDSLDALLIAIPDDDERKKILEDQIKLFTKKNVFFTSFDENSAFSLIEQALTSFSFLTKYPAVLLDRLEERKKEEIDRLLELLKPSDFKTFFLAGTRSLKNIGPLLEFFEKKGAILDLTQEKPWDREKRFLAEVFSKVQKEAKTIQAEAAELIVKKVGLDAHLLESELTKILLFVGERKNIEVKDVDIIQQSNSSTIFQWADRLVWGQRENLEFFFEEGFFYPVLHAIRSQLKIGLKLAILSSKNFSPEDLLAFFPKIFPSQLERKKTIAIEKGKKWFVERLIKLFEIELLSKTTGSELLELWHLLNLIFEERLNHAVSSP